MLRSPSADEMSSFEVLYQRLGGRKTDKYSRIKLAAHPGSWGAIFDTPRRRSVDGGHGDLGLLKSLDNSRERLPNFSRETEACGGLSEVLLAHTKQISRKRTEDSIHNVVGRFQGFGKVLDKRDLEIFQLLGKPLRASLVTVV